MIAQLLYDALAKRRPHGLSGKLFTKLVSTARQIALKADDPLVDYTVGDSSIKIPLSHNLGVYYRNDAMYAVSLASIAKAVQSKYRDLTFIDVGANVGDTTPLLRSKANFPILAIEGDPKFYEMLELNSRKFENVTTVKRFLGESDQLADGFSFVASNGTGRLAKSETASDATKIVRLDALLEEYPAFAGAKMIKTDTDGFDGKVLRGAAATLRKVKPVVFFEYAPFYWQQQGEDCVSIFSFLKDTGYSKFMVFLPSGEYFCSSRTDNTDFIEELRVIHKKLYFYCDICAFAEADLDLFEQVRQQELAAVLAQKRW
ncbi:MAG: FkbM family methyltransferase [Deltaproteobacteria bacterium]|nr:FkbM family methyltransferase [Deltaproteobacteria bacterium]